MLHHKGKCPECGRNDVAVTRDRRVWRHDHIAMRRVVCPGVGRPASNLDPRQLEFTAEQLGFVDLVDHDGRLVAFAVPGPRDDDETDMLFTSGLQLA